jgi:predicted nucleotidyltransferase
VNPQDPNVIRVEVVAEALGDLCDELVLVGGCAASLLIDAPTASPARVTYDVDVIAEVAALHGYHALERQFAGRGFSRDVSENAPICHWRIRDIEVDLMPTDEKILGFANRWYPEAASTARPITLPSGRRINLISAPAFLATKFEAFHTRGNNDVVMSHDLEDIVNVVEGRLVIVDEVAVAETSLRAYLAMRFAELRQHPDFENTLPGLIAYDELFQRRIEAVRYRISAIARFEPQ